MSLRRRRQEARADADARREAREILRSQTEGWGHVQHLLVPGEVRLTSSPMKSLGRGGTYSQGRIFLTDKSVFFWVDDEEALALAGIPAAFGVPLSEVTAAGKAPFEEHLLITPVRIIWKVGNVDGGAALVVDPEKTHTYHDIGLPPGRSADAFYEALVRRLGPPPDSG